ncbi:MAG: hypothetical protein KGI03_04490 [Patescibacteria group bacterium]|nr:hypothetical protein [Patescibacteria group bacterium]
MTRYGRDERLTMARRHQQREEVSQVIHLPRSEWQFTDETIRALSEYGEALRAVYNRMRAEGYTIRDGKVCRVEEIQA